MGSPQELTEAERRIADRVAAGLSNKEVAATLFLSVSTVEAALWKIYRKLDVRSRTQLAARLAERERAGTAASVSTPAASRPDPPQ